MIFKSIERMDADGNITNAVSWGIGGFGQAKKDKQEFQDALNEQAHKRDKQAIADFNHMVKVQNKSVSEAIANLGGASEAVKQYCQDAGAAGADVDKFTEKQKAQQEALEKSKKGFKGLSAATKAMGANILLDLGVAAAIAAISAGWNKLNNEFKITPAKKIEAMETAVNDYNAAMEESQNGIKTIQSLESEFTRLSQGVDDSGRNISLSAEEYERYNEIVKELVGISPELVQGYTAEGNAIIDRNTAIRDGIQAQKDYADAAKAAFTSSTSGNDVIEGATINITKSINNAQESLVALGKALQDTQVAQSNLPGVEYTPGSVSNTTSNIISSYFGREVDLASASVSDMEKITTEWNAIIKKAKENGYSHDVIEEARSEFGNFKTEFAGIQDSYKPIYEWLNAVATEADEAGNTIAGSIPESMQSGFQAGLKEIAATGEDASAMKSSARQLANDLKEIYSSNEGGYADALKEAKEAQEDFIDSDRTKDDVVEYDKVVQDHIDTVIKLAEKYQKAGDDITAAALFEEASKMANFATEHVLTLAEAFNPLASAMEEAQGAKEKFDNAMSANPDYDTAINSFKEVFDEILDGDDNKGNGSKAFWQGAEQILGSKTIRELGGDFDKVNARLKELKSGAKDSASATGKFFNMLLDNADEISDLDLGKVWQESNGEIKFDIDSSNWAEVADILGVSYEYLIAMLDMSRKWADIDLSDGNAVKTAISEMETTHKTADGEMYQLYSNIQSEAVAAGLSIEELDGKIKDLASEGVHVIDLEVDAPENIADALSGMSSQLATEKDGKYKINIEKTVAQLLDMGASEAQIEKTISKWEKDEDKKFELQTKKPDDTEWSEWIGNIKTEWQAGLEDTDDPFTKLSDSADKFASSIERLIAAMGFMPDIDIESNLDDVKEDIDEFALNYGNLSDIEKEKAVEGISDQIEEAREQLDTLKALRDDPNNKLTKDQKNQLELDITNAEENIEKYSALLEDVKDDGVINNSINCTIKGYEELLATNEAIEENSEEPIEKTVVYSTSLGEEYDKIDAWGLGEYAEEIKNGTIQSVFGNVDMDKRPIIEWSDELKKTYQDELASWTDGNGNAYDPIVGQIDTVFGGSSGFKIGDETVEVAYTPIMEVDGEAKYLGKNTLYNYIQSIVDEANKDGQWTLDEILKLDAKGLEVDKINSAGEVVGKEFVKGVIAAVGDEGGISAQDVGGLMHFAGDYGAIGLASSAKDLSAEIIVNYKESKSLDAVINNIREIEDTELQKEVIFETVADGTFRDIFGYLSNRRQNILLNAIVNGEGDFNQLWNIINRIDNQEVRAQIVGELANSGAFDEFLNNISLLTEDDQKIVVDALVKNEGDVEKLNEILSGLEERDKINLSNLIESSGIKLTADTSGVEEGAETTRATLDDLPELTETFISGDPKGVITAASQAQNALDLIPKNPFVYIDGSLSERLKTAASTMKTLLNQAKSAGWAPAAEGTSNRRVYPAMSKGGKVGPNGNGGLTLTGELGPELAWLPDQNESFLVGQYGPEMVNLPANAVVWPADETKRIIGDTVPHNRMRFGSSAKGHMTFGTMSTGGFNSSSYGGSGSKSSSKSKSSSSSDSAYEKAKKELEHQLEMGYITESEYYTKLKKLYDKYKKDLKKNVDDQRAALEDLRSAWIDAYEAAVDSLDHQLEMGKISEADYLKQLKALGDKYFKNRKGYDKEWKDHLEDRKDAAKDAYDAEVEALEDSLDRGLISIQNYYAAVTKLQNKYLTGKEMADDLKDAQDDMYDNLMDGLDKIWEDAEQQIEDNDLFGTWVEGGPTAIEIMEDAFDEIEKLSHDYFATETERLEYLKDKERELAEAKKDAYEDQQDQLDTILDLIEDMLRQEAEDYIDSLEKQKDAYQELIDAKKKSLQLTESELGYQEEMADYANQISDLQADIELLSRDDSRSALAQRAEKEKELAELLKEQQQAQREETLNKTEDNLDDQAELFAALIDKQIEIVQNWLDNKSAVLEVVMDTVEQRETNNLLNRLIAYNGEHGDAMMSTIEDAMNDLDNLVAEYGNDIESIVEILQKGINVHVTGGIIETEQTDYAETQAETKNKPVTHHDGLATGFTGDGADRKQHEVYRLLTDDELVFNRADQMRIASQLQVLDTVKESFSSLAKGTVSQPAQTNQTVELVINAPITIQGNVTTDVVEKIEKAIDSSADKALAKLNEALRINGVHSRTSSNLRKN